MKSYSCVFSYLESQSLKVSTFTCHVFTASEGYLLIAK